ncbi:MAG: hypothetical protein GKR90_12180 [Pseudomonadales bacterium]|nr:hypothetical protein [Pseudomonadales bacterium]
MIDRSRKYTKDEVSDIVRDALNLSRSEDSQSMTRDDLEDIARQCGVDEETLELALAKRELDAHKKVIREKWRKKVVAKLWGPVLGCSGLVLLNLSTGGFPWVLFPLAFWLLPTVAQTWKHIFPSEEYLTQTAERYARKPAHS